MGIFASRAIKPFKNWNILNRALKQIEKDKIHIRPATNVEYRIQMNPETICHDKRDDLVSRVNRFEIIGREMIEVDRPRVKSHRPLPQKFMGNPLEYDDETERKEPMIVPEGRMTLALVIEMMKKFRGDVTVDQLADEYKLPPEKVYNILQYNRLFVLNPKTTKKRQLLIGEEDFDSKELNEDNSDGPRVTKYRQLYPEVYGKEESS